MFTKNAYLWLLWAVITAAGAGYFMNLLDSETADKSVFMPGKTTDGHHQIELACGACHGESFTDKDVIQEACMNCHGTALEQAKDKHPKSKFTDPRNADRLAVLDARYCATCHVEHRPEMTTAMGLTLPPDYCHLCHQDIADDRPSHADMEFDTCASAGCHNYHDNQALYEDFLVKHANEPAVLEKMSAFPELNLGEIAPLVSGYPIESYPIGELDIAAADAPPEQTKDATIMTDWLASRHAASGVNCSACHLAGDRDQPAWVESPTYTVCESCHVEEVGGWLAGKHGMRMNSEKLQQHLHRMTPALARLPMKAEVADKELDCHSCHTPHRYDIRKAAVESCLACHDDTHSLAYIDSPHHQLWQQELAGEIDTGLGVSCATCHMPRIEKEYNWGEFYHTLTQHNQSETLRPNEKMIRPVCMNCHGLEFSINALADSALVQGNFHTSPSVHINGIEMAVERAQEAEERKRRIREQNRSTESE